MSASDVFGRRYAGLYDTVYANKDYDTECATIKRAIERYGPSPSQRILDLGCGTGGHAIRLATDGYEVTGLDLSSEMLARAREKAAVAGVRLELHRSDLRNFELNSTFDVALMMFAVLGYQNTNAAVRSTLDRARNHLVDRGLLIFDVWYGPAVLLTGPEKRSRRYERDGMTIVRESDAVLDVNSNLCEVEIRMWEARNGEMEPITQESHRMRYFFGPELELFLTTSGFELVKLSAFPDIDQPPAADTWNVLGIARAV